MVEKIFPILGPESPNVLYKNALVTRVREDDVYDIKFSGGRIESLVENISSFSFSSGEYVAVLISSRAGMSTVYKIIGKGRRIETENIPIVFV